MRAREEGTFFHLAQWRLVLESAFGHATHYLLAERNGAICGVLPLAELRSRLFGHALGPTPFGVYGGVVAADAAAHDALTERACGLARTLGVDHLELRNRRRANPDWPCKDLYVTFRGPISPDAEENMRAIPRKQRAMVRKGGKEGLKAELHGDGPGTMRRTDSAQSEAHRSLPVATSRCSRTHLATTARSSRSCMATSR